MELSKEQVAYLNSLDSKKKKRKFIIYCLVEKFSGSLGESEKIEKPTLEVGKWYTFKNNPSNWWLGCISDKNLTYYGFNEGRWFNQNKYGLINTNADDYKLATPQEVETALINEAKKRGFKYNVEFKPINCLNTIKKSAEYFGYDETSNKLLFNNYCIFDNGKWAEIIDEKPTDLPSEPNYSPEEIDLVKHNINQREISEQGSELLKFDKLENYKTKEEYLEILEKNLKNKELLDILYEHLLGEERFKLAKIFIAQIQLLNAVQLIKNDKSAK